MFIKSILVPAVRALAVALSLLPALAFGTATINLSFTPATINPGDPSQLAVSIFNSGTSALSAAAVTINLATGVTIGATPVTNDTCGFSSVSAPASGTLIKLSGGSVPAAVPGGADGSCTFTVNINSTTPGNLGTTIPANGPSNGFTPGGAVSGFSADDGGSTITNATAATATLAVNAISAPTGAITYSPASVYVGEVTRMSITLTNNNASVTLPLSSFTDTLPAGLTIAATPTPTITCASGTAGTLSSPSVGGTVTPGDSSITLTGGTIAGGSTCVIAVNVVAGNTTGTQTNTVAANAIGNTRGLTSASFTRNITVSTPVGLAQSFSGGATVRSGQASTLTLTITNNSAANLLNITSFTDNLAAGLLITASPAPAVSCTGTGGVNGTLTATAGTTVISLAGATAAKSGTCVITVGVSMATAGTLASTAATTVGAGTQMTNAAVSPGNLSVPASSANLTSASQFTIAKSASTGASAYQGQAITYTVTISNWSPGAATNVSFTDNLPSVGGVPMTLGAGSALGAGCSGGTFSATAGATAVTWTGGTVAGGVGTAAGTCVITIVTAMPAGSTVGDAYTNNLPINTSVTGTDINSTNIKNTNAASVTTNATASVTVSQNYGTNPIYQGASTVLTVTITNPTASALTGTAFSETFNAAVTVAAVPLTSSTCTGTPVITAVPGAGSFSASGLTVPAGGNCNVKVSITSATVGAFANSVAIGAITDDLSLSNTSAANRTLTVSSPISAVAAFSPASAGVGGSSRLTIAVTNNGATALSNVSITAPMQTGANSFVVSSTPGASSTCAGSTAITANAGATSASMTGASLAAGANCTLAFNITTVTGGNWSFSMPAGNITSTEGAINTAAVTATLTKATVVLGVNKSFAPNSINGGTPSVLQVDITNPLGAASAANGVAFTDTFPTGMEVYATPNASTTCTNGVVSAVPGDNKISLSAADVAIGSTCSVLVNVTSVKPLNLTNTIAIGALSSQQGFTNTLATSASLSTLQGLGVIKSFSPIAIAPGQVSHLAIKLISTLNTTTLNNVSVTDTLPSGVVVAPTPNVSSTCDAAPSPSAGASSIAISGVSIAAQTNCTIQVDVTAASPGTYTNTIGVGGATSTEGYANQTATTAVLNVMNAPTVALAYGTGSVQAGTATTLTMTLANTNASALTASALSVNLPAGLSVDLTPGTNTTCGGSVVATAAGSSIALSGATIPANGTCTFRANVSSNTPASYVASVPIGAISTAQGVSNTASASATLIVLQFPTVSQSLSVASIAPGGTTRLTITLGNSNASAITMSSVFTDTLPVTPGNLLIVNPNGLTTTCTLAKVTATAGSGAISYSATAATIPAGGCTIAVNLTASALGTYTNTIPAGALQTTAGNSQAASTTTLTVSSNTPPNASNFSAAVNNNAASAVAIGPMVGTPQAGATISTYTITALPANATLYCAAVAIASVPSTCTASGLTILPVGAPTGTSTFTYTVTDSNALTSSAATATITWNTPPTAAAVNNAAISSAAVTAQALSSLSGTATTTGATITTYTVASLPAAGTLYCSAVVVASVPTNCAANGLSFRPSGSAVNPVTFTYTVTDSNAMTSAAATVSIPLNVAPTASNFSAAVNNNAASAVAIGPMAGTPQAGATISTYTVTSLPANATLYCSAVAIASAPATCAASGLTILPAGAPTGTSTFTYTVTDSNALTSSTATATITWNTPPTAAAVNNAAISSAAVTAQALSSLSGTATTAGATITTYTVASLPAAGTLYCSAVAIASVPSNCAANGLSFRPSGSAVNPVTFTYTVTDSNGMSSSAAIVSIPLNTAPAANNFNAAVNNNALSAVGIGPMSGSSQAGSSITTYTVTSLPASSTLYCTGTTIATVPVTCSANGLSIRPTANPVAASTFGYTVTDSNGLTSNSATATITWNTPPTAAAVNNAAISSAAVTAQALSSLSGSATTTGATITTYTVASLPSAGTLYCSAVAIASVPSNCAANGLGFRPSGSVVNPVTFTYTVTDSNGMSSAAATVSIPLNVAPSASNFSAAVNNNAASAVAIGPMVGTPQAGATISTYTVTSLPANATLYCSAVAIASVPSNCAANGLSVRPTGAPTGTSTFNYTVTDSNTLTSSAATATITWNTPPVANAVNESLDSTQAGPYAVPSLSGLATTAGTTLSTYTVTSIPPASAGVLSCSGVGITSPPVTCAPGALTFAPAPGASGAITFQYTVTDANGMVSLPATATLTLLTAPVATAITAGPLDTAVTTPQALPSLAGTVTTPGATLTIYTITTLPTPASGTLYCNGVAVSAVPAACAPNSLALRVAPGASGFAGFSYTVTDSNHLVSAPVAVTIALQGSPALTLRKTSNGAMTIGFEAVYTLQVSNRSTTTATSAAVTVTDTLPAALDFISAAGVNATSDWTCNWTAATRVVSCASSAVVAANANAEAIAVHVKPNAAALASGSSSQIINSAAVAGGGETPGFANGTAPGAQPHTSTDTQTVQAPASISGSSWVDSNHNGVKDSGEPTPPAGSMRVEIWPAGTTAAQAASGTPITSAMLDPNGGYQVNVPPGNLMVRFVDVSTGTAIGTPVNGETAASRNQTGVTSSTGISIAGAIDNIIVTPGAVITQQSLPIDPQGVVYDAGTRLPIGGATVTLVARGQPVPASCLAGGPNPYITPATGSFAGGYQFLLDFNPAECAALSGATFNLQVSAAGYRSPSTLIPPGLNGHAVLTTPAGSGLYAVVPRVGVPAAGDPTTYYLSLVLGSASMGVVNNNIPLDGSAPAAVVVTKTASRATAEIGDTVRYTITVRNAGQAVLPALTLTDRLPLGFKLIDKSAVATNGATSTSIATASLGPVIDFVIPGLRPGATETLQYLVRIGIGADKGDGTNHVRASVGGLTSNEATATVKVTGGVFGTDACLAGKVFMDCNGDGVQGTGEPGVAGVRLWLETGVSIITDAQGKFSYCGLAPRTHAIKIDPATLPPGTTPLITSNRNLGDAGSLLLDAKQGELIRADFALGHCAARPKPDERGRSPDKDASPRVMFEGTANSAARAQEASHE